MWLIKALFLPAVLLLLLISLNAFANSEIRLEPGGSPDFETRGEYIRNVFSAKSGSDINSIVAVNNLLTKPV